jgi:superkiller protein 3
MNAPSCSRRIVDAYEEAIALGHFDTGREFADSHFRLGQTLYWQRARLDQSALHMERAIRLDPSHAKAHMLLGRIYYDQGRGIELAEAELRESLRLTPHSKWSYYHLAVIYEREGLLEKAVAACQKALELDPQLTEAQELWKKLNSVER